MGGGGNPSDIKAYLISQRSPAGVAENPDQSWLTDAKVTQASGRTLIEFTRPLNNGGNGKVITWDSPTTFVYAFGSGNSIQYHGQNRGPDGGFQINFPALLAPPTPAPPTPPPTPSPPAGDLSEFD